MKALDNVVTGKEESLMLMTDPPLPMAYGKVCAYMYVNRDSSQGYGKNRLHCEVSISEPDDLDECIIYNVAHVDKKWAVAFLRGLLENNQVPDISGWNVLADRHTHFDVENLTTIIRILTEHLPQQNRDAAREKSQRIPFSSSTIF